MSAPFFPGFEPFDIDVGETTVHGVAGGAGPPLLLLHGYPQTHVMWHRVAPALAERHRVVAADLRGYGASGKPPTTPDHAAYSKRAMASDLVAAMAALGHERFDVCGHDRGGRVGHRMALDHPGAVARLMVLDIAPTREMYRGTDDAFARAYWHWFFLIRPAPLPEELISADSDRYFRGYLKYKPGTDVATDGDGIEPFDAGALEHYLAALRDPAAVHASCEDYRAAATIDIAHDDADGERRVGCPLRCLWGEHGVVAACFDPLALWRERAADVSGRALACGHYLAEELPDETPAEMRAFFAAPMPARAPDANAVDGARADPVLPADPADRGERP